MTDKPKKLSETAHALLTAAALRDDHLIKPPQLPAAAARQVVRLLLNAQLAEEIPAAIDGAGYVWRQGDNGSGLMLRATELGLACIREEDNVPTLYPARTTIAVGADTDGTLAPEQPLVGDMSAGEPQAEMPPRRHRSPRFRRPPPNPLTPCRTHRRCRCGQLARAGFARPHGHYWKPGGRRPRHRHSG